MMSIPDLATEMIDKTLSSVREANSSTIFFVGNKSVGKSSLIHSFLDKPDTPRETLVLEYSFGRKTVQTQGIDKNVCHIWEYGGNPDMLKSVLSSVPVRGNHAFCVMVDLSKVKLIWNTLEKSIPVIEEIITLSKVKPASEVTIIGGKYDIFKNYDNEIKKLICNTLRSLSLIHNCNLFFYSSKDSTLVRRAKDVLHCIGFGKGFPTKDRISSFNKPLYIPIGTDSWESIGIAPSTLQQIKSRHLASVPLETEDWRPLTSDYTDLNNTYAEPILDSFARVKYDELRDLTSFDMPIINNFYGNLQ